MINNVHVFIGFFDRSWSIKLFRDQQGLVPEFDNHSQASEYILANGLGTAASPVEVSEVVIPVVRNQG